MCLAVPGRITGIRHHGTGLIATVDYGSGSEREADLAFVPDARVGDWVLAHSGFVVRTLTAEEAGETVDLLRNMTRTVDPPPGVA